MKKTLAICAATLLVVLTGCGGGGSSSVTQSSPQSPAGPQLQPLPANNPPQNQNSLLSGPYGLLSINVGPRARGGAVGLISLDGAGGIPSGSYTTYSSSGANALRQITSGAYTVAMDRTFSGSITSDNGVTTNGGGGRLSSSQVFAAANWQDSNADQGQFMLVKPLANPTLASLSGAYRFSLARVGVSSGFAYGTINFNGAGNITGGTLTNQSNVSRAIAPGTYTVGANGSVTGAWNDSGVITNVNGFVGQDRSLGFVLKDSLGEVALGVSNPGPSGTSSNADLSGEARFLVVRTSPTGGYVTGTIRANGAGVLTSGELLYSDATTATLTSGLYSILSNGTYAPANTVITTSNGAVTRPNFLTLHQDKTVSSGVLQDNQGNQGVVLLVK